jgi:hypothetical protein
LVEEELTNEGETFIFTVIFERYEGEDCTGGEEGLGTVEDKRGRLPFSIIFITINMEVETIAIAMIIATIFLF